MTSETVGRAQYELSVDMKPLKKGLGDAEASIKKSGQTAEEAFARKGTAAANKMAASQGLLVRQGNELKKGILAGVGIGGGLLAFNALQAGVSAVVGVLGDAVKAAAEEEAQIKQLSTAVKENDASWDGNIEALEKVIAARQDLAFSDGEQRDGLKQLVGVTQDVTKALELQSIAMDLARFKGMDLTQASVLIGKVYAGNFAALSRYGIVLEKGATATEALAAIQRRAAGQASAYANSTQGRLVVAQIALDNAMEDLGATLLPLVSAMAQAASDVIPKLSAAFEELGAQITPLLDDLGLVDTHWQAWEEKIRQTGESLGMTSDDIEDLTNKLKLVDVTSAEWVDTLGRGADEMERNAILQAALDDATKKYTQTIVTADSALDGLTFSMVDTEKATGVAIEGWRQANRELRGLIRTARGMADENDHTGKRLRELVAQEKTLRREQAEAAEKGNARQVTALQRAIEKNNDMQEELRATLDLLHLIQNVKQIRIQLTSNIAAFSAQLAGLFGQVAMDAGDVQIGGGGGRRGRRGRHKDGQHGATFYPGDWGHVGEAGMERIRNIAGATVVEPIPGAGRTPAITVNLTVNAGQFWQPIEAQRWAQAAAPALGRELQRIGIGG